MAAFAQRNLDRLGVGAAVVEGDALEGHEARAPYDRIHSGTGVSYVPPAWVEQLAPAGRLLTTLVTRTPSRPDNSSSPAPRPARSRRSCGAAARVPALARPPVAQRARIKADPGGARPTRLAPPPDDAYGFWLAAAYLAPGLVRDFQAETMTIVAPEDDSWAVAGPGDGTVRVHGPRDVRAELEDVHARWEQAGRPDQYRVDFQDGSAAQYVASGTGLKALAWPLPPLAVVPRQTP
jgi:hypothetical protein